MTDPIGGNRYSVGIPGVRTPCGAFQDLRPQASSFKPSHGARIESSKFSSSEAGFVGVRPPSFMLTLIHVDTWRTPIFGIPTASVNWTRGFSPHWHQIYDVNVGYLNLGSPRLDSACVFERCWRTRCPFPFKMLESLMNSTSGIATRRSTSLLSKCSIHSCDARYNLMYALTRAIRVLIFMDFER